MGFDPITALTVASTVISGTSAVMAGMSQSAAEERRAVEEQERASIAERNQQIAETNAVRATERAQVQAQDQDMLTLAMIGTQEAQQGASGLTGRTQGRVRSTARRLGRQDALNIRQEGDVQAFNFRVQAENEAASARVAQRRSSAHEDRAESSLLSGFLNAGQSLVGGATSIAKRRMGTPRFQPAGA